MSSLSYFSNAICCWRRWLERRHISRADLIEALARPKDTADSLGQRLVANACLTREQAESLTVEVDRLLIPVERPTLDPRGAASAREGSFPTIADPAEMPAGGTMVVGSQTPRSVESRAAASQNDLTVAPIGRRPPGGAPTDAAPTSHLDSMSYALAPAGRYLPLGFTRAASASSGCDQSSAAGRTQHWDRHAQSSTAALLRAGREVTAGGSIPGV